MAHADIPRPGAESVGLWDPALAGVEVSALGPECQVWWADPALASADHLSLLDRHELARWERLRRTADRDRFVVGVALLRLVVGACLALDPRAVRLDRSCGHCGEPHGKPQVREPGALQVSVSHSVSRVALAVIRTYEVGVDVERIDRDLDVDAMAEHVLSPRERREIALVPESSRADEFFVRWTRKEAVLKATGDGLRVPLDDLTVSTGDLAVLHEWRGRPDLPARVSLVDLRPGEGYLASLAVIDARPDVVEIDASRLLRSWRTPS